MEIFLTPSIRRWNKKDPVLFVLSIKYDGFDYVNGLFCLWSAMEHPPVIYNPTTRIVRYLPCLDSIDHRFTCYSYSFGFELDGKKYKILMSSHPLDPNSLTKHWVLTLGSNESWREIKSEPCSSLLLLSRGLCMEGFIYFLGIHEDKRCIVTFNVRTENFRIISLWADVIDVLGGIFCNLMQVKGKLAVISQSRWNVNEIYLRILQSCENEEWVKHTITFSETLCSSLMKNFIGCISGSTPDGEIVFISNSMFNGSWIVYYDLKKKS
ncbi:hypothetical protein FXO38_14276 [Capsicum annuum]|uniref:F-box associated beta-propeller type 3 domain-containing protein n=1 Tax=Capsicum annuum TaxID=4072 RepID=A0A2G2YCL3_CAPAN|nr:putative F-box protein At1g47730 [Capsicum annuum]XP_047255374.1 putative F-box protein At1g47730 [Capsicum annuum]KAF3656191.1 hypothetical protein FXO38_14276 [Capsicum annuum]KAF3680313.1 hypothetical protein FXO37_03381 [Capsicum annuum]PHT67470.1 hypothetical protein T459_26957 [Capsicum annuum]